MPKPAPNTADQADFVLKHRITGAAFLLFFGALFLPWLLGPPSEALKAEEPPQPAGLLELSSSEIENELLAALESEDEDVPEQVYISKITPLDEAPSEAAKPENLQATSDKKNVENIQPTKTNVVESKKQQKPEFNQPNINSKAVKTPVKPAVVAESPGNKELEPKKVEFGWVVQVGVFEKSEGVAKELSDLRAQGFSPSTSEMETNQKSGKATRIWLGPFSRRVDAAKTKTQLTEKTGKAGYIRAYP